MLIQCSCYIIEGTIQLSEGLCCVLFKRDMSPLPWYKLKFKSYNFFFCLFWPTASEKKLLQNKIGPGLSHSKHNSWSESLSSVIRLMPGRNTKETACKSEVTFALCHLHSVTNLALSSGEFVWLWEASEYVFWGVSLKIRYLTAVKVPFLDW